MDIRELLEQVRFGSAETEDTQIRLKDLPYEDLGYTKPDHCRKLHSGFRETASCQGKPDTYLLEIYKKLYERDREVLGTRASESQVELARIAIPGVMYDPISRILKVKKLGKEYRGYVAVYTGDTVDTPAAEEAAQTAEYFGCNADRIFDVGITGIHRLLTQRERLGKVNYIAAVARMEGILGTVIAGLVECPAVVVPASVGHGASFRELSALLVILNPCVSGISVVNANNGYGAGYLAA